MQWLAEGPGSMAELSAAGPVLVHVFEFAQLNSVRTLPYLAEWHRRYAEHGLTVLGVQAPRFPFGADRGAVAAGLERLGVEYPALIDGERELWQDYGCEGWPSLFLWGRGGALRWFHFGEGEYLATEEAIQEELRAVDTMRRLPEPLEPLRASDAPGARVMPPSPELFPGPREGVPAAEGEPITLEYAAGGAYATLEGEGELEVDLDGAALKPIEVDGAGLYELALHPRHESHVLRIAPPPGMAVWSISFAAGVP